MKNYSLSIMSLLNVDLNAIILTNISLNVFIVQWYYKFQTDISLYSVNKTWINYSYLKRVRTLCHPTLVCVCRYEGSRVHHMFDNHLGFR